MVEETRSQQNGAVEESSHTPKPSTPQPEVDTNRSPQTLNQADKTASASPSTRSNGPGSVFSNALQTWTEIDLPSLQRKLDDQGLELKEDQKKSLLNRKDLASKTKDFKKLSDEEKLAQFKTLLKSYQNEIDSLTTKKKQVEGYFFGIYRLIAEAPDPKPLLEVSLDAVADYSESGQLKKELSRLNEELSKKADYDQLKQRLIRNEQKSAELLSTQLKAKEDEFKALIDEKESNWAEKEKALNKQISDSKHKIEELRTSNEVTSLQLKNGGQGVVQDSAASASIVTELEIVSRDAESSKLRIFDLEKRNEKLRLEFTKLQNQSEIESIKENFTKKISELEGENALLIANLDQVKKKFDFTNQDNAAKVEGLNKQTNHLQQELIKVKEELDSRSDYTELKQENHILRQLQFGQDDEEQEGNEVSGAAGEGANLSNSDSIFQQKNKALTQELAEFRSEHESFVTRISDLEQQLQNTSEELTRTQLLNDRLENDIADLQEVGGGSIALGGVGGGSSGAGGKFNDNMSLISGVTKMTGILAGGGGASGGRRNGSIIGGDSSKTMDESSILPIITKQRDRFRDRNNELEEELKKQYNTISELKRSMNALKKDNEELYERTRYLASFKNNSNLSNFTADENTSTTFSSRGSNRKLLEPKPNNVVAFNNPYQASYESKLHPIEQFRLREQERINSKLSPLERLFISFSRAILATRTTRMLFAAYCIGLHCIVMFVTIYSMSLNTSMIPEVGINTSTGGVASGVAGSPDTLAHAVLDT